MLYKGLPPGLILWGHQFISFQTSKDKSTVGVKCRVAETGEIVEIEVDLLVAADGCLSAIRQNFLPNLKLRCALLRPKTLSTKCINYKVVSLCHIGQCHKMKLN